MAGLAHHFHWSLDVLLDLEHRDRRRFLAVADGLAEASRRELPSEDVLA
jgi:hypothetical protein